MISGSSDEGLPQGEAKAVAVRRMFDEIAPRYDLVNRLMTFGLDVLWRRRTVTELRLTPGSVVVDLACGTGDLCSEIRRHGMSAVGVDFSARMLTSAHTSAPLMQGDIQRLPLRSGAVDGAVCGFALRNLVDLDAFFSELARVIRPGGRIGLLEVDTPESAIMAAGHRIYFGHVVPRIGALLSSASAYRYLPRSVAYLPDRDDLARRISAAGFESVTHTPLTGGICQLITGSRKR